MGVRHSAALSPCVCRSFLVRFLPCSVTSTTLHFTILHRLSSPPPFAPILHRHCRAPFCVLRLVPPSRAPRPPVPWCRSVRRRNPGTRLYVGWFFRGGPSGARAPYAVARRQARACAVHFLCASFHVPSPAPLFTSPFFTASPHLRPSLHLCRAPFCVL